MAMDDLWVDTRLVTREEFEVLAREWARREGYVKLDGIKAAFDAGFLAALRDDGPTNNWLRSRQDLKWREYERKVLAALDQEAADG